MKIEASVGQAVRLQLGFDVPKPKFAGIRNMGRQSKRVLPCGHTRPRAMEEGRNE